MASSISRSTKLSACVTEAIRIAALLTLGLAASIATSQASTVLYDSGDPPQGPGPSVFSDQWLAQVFTPTAPWQMTTVSVFAAGTEPITLILAADAGGLPGAVLDTWTIDKTDWDPAGSWGSTAADFAFSQGVSYWFEYTSSGDLFSGDFLPTPAPNGVPDIAFSSDQGQTWSLIEGAGPLGLRIENDGIEVTPEPKMTVILALVGLTVVLLSSATKRPSAARLFECLIVSCRASARRL
jgi:hypothetical protein